MFFIHPLSYYYYYYYYYWCYDIFIFNEIREESSKAKIARREELKRVAEAKALQKKQESLLHLESQSIDMLKSTLDLEECKLSLARARLNRVDSEMEVVSLKEGARKWHRHQFTLYKYENVSSSDDQYNNNNRDGGQTATRGQSRQKYIVTNTQPPIFWIEGKPHEKTERLHYESGDRIQEWQRSHDSKLMTAVEVFKTALGKEKEKMDALESRKHESKMDTE